MFGVAEMFAEFAVAERDDFTYRFTLEQTRERTLRAKRARERRRYHRITRDPIKLEARRAYKRKWIREYLKRRAQNDPVWAAEHRRKHTERERIRRPIRAQARAA